jgi:hypothetical protein
MTLAVIAGLLALSYGLDAMGVDSRLALQIQSGVQVAAGIGFMFAPVPGARALGASLIGGGAASFGGGYLSEHLGGSYQTGWTVGNIVGGIAGGGIYGTTKHGQVAKYSKYWDKGTFKNSKASLQYHHAKHGAGMSVKNYTMNAVSFSNQNATSLKFIVPKNSALSPHWTFVGKVGWNGHFTSAGKILTYFWVF